MEGFDAVEFEVHFGAIVAGAATSVKLQTSSDDSNWNDLEGTSITVEDTDGDKIFRLDLSHPREQFIRCVVSRATQNATVDSIVARQYLPHKEPVVDDTSVGGSGFSHAAAEGTA